MLQQLVTTTFTNFACEALDQLRDSQSHKCRPTYHEFELVISRMHFTISRIQFKTSRIGFFTPVLVHIMHFGS